MLQRLAIDRGAILYDPRHVAEPGAQLFDPQFWSARGALRERPGGRGSILLIEDGARSWVLRRYLRSPTVMIVLRRHPRLAKLPGRDGLLRSLLPNRGTRLVVRHDDVVQVLREDRGFGVPYLPKMLGLDAPFMLGLPRSADHARMRIEMGEALYVDPTGAALTGASRRAAANALDGRSKIEVIGPDTASQAQ